MKTDAGRDEIRSRVLGLPMSVRAILLMVDGQRTVSAMRALIAGSKAPADVLDDLVARGLIEPRVTRLAATISETPPVPTPVVPEANVSAAARGPESTPAPVAPVSAMPPHKSYDTPLDLVLPTIYGAEAGEQPRPVSPGAAQRAAEPAPGSAGAGAAPPDRYEHLYAMMNEIVRDFLAPHRRYFFQLKIERCGTADELLELLHGLQTALAKTRGEAFASDVIARLRAAAN